MTEIHELLAKVGGNAREILRLFKEDRFPEHEMFEDGVIELCQWTLQLEQHVRNLLEKPKPEPTIRCELCKGDNVSAVMWVNPNTAETENDFGSWKEEDTKYCNDCDDHVRLVDTSFFPYNLKPGDTVVWCDPDESVEQPQKTIKLESIEAQSYTDEAVVSISGKDVDGDVDCAFECLWGELKEAKPCPSTE
jgi:hypothetical protein